MIEQLFSPSLVENLGWTILHSLWELPAVAALLAMALRRIPAGRAELRYVVCCAGLAVMALAPVATFFVLAQQAAGLPVAAETLRVEWAGVLSAPGEASGMPWPVIVVNLWALGVLAMALRLAGGLYAARRLRMRASESALPEAVRRLAHAIAARMGIGRLRIAASAEIGSPLVMGVLRPMVLLPLAALSQLPPEQWEAILAHELAHIRRYDLLVNLVQSVLETVYFYHPAFWWVSRQVRREREHCCDDLAVRVSGDALVVARALVSLEQLRQRPLLALAASEGPLFQRLQRLLMERTPASAQAGPMALCAVALLLIAGSVQAWQAPPPPPAPPVPPAPAANAPAPPRPPRPPKPPQPAGAGSIHIDETAGGRRLLFHDTDGTWFTEDPALLAEFARQFAPLKEYGARMRAERDRMRAAGDKMRAQADRHRDAARSMQQGEARKLGELARQMARANESDRERLSQEMERLSREIEQKAAALHSIEADMKPFEAEMKAFGEAMEKHGAEMDRLGKEAEHNSQKLIQQWKAEGKLKKQ